MPWMLPAAIGGSGLLSAGGSIFSGILGSNAASKAAQEEVAQQEQALQFQQNVYGQTVQNLAPYRQAGNTALTSVMGLLGLGGTGQNATAQSAFQGFTQTPYYQFPLQQGNLALNRQLASAGLTGSGAALKDATAYNQGYASQGLGSYLQQLMGLSGQGENAAALQGSQGNQASSLLAQIFGNIGGAQAAGTVGSTNALTSGISNAGGSLLGSLTNPAVMSYLQNLGVQGQTGTAYNQTVGPQGMFGGIMGGAFQTPTNGPNT
jgi:hypothetical protein